MAFNENDRNSPLGVTVRMATHDDFHINCGNGCYNGYSDCKMSASIYNHRVMHDSDGHLVAAMSRNAGIVFNQAAVEASLGKCFFQYDGGTYNRVNRGCGCTAPNDCHDPEGAFLNPATGSHPLANGCSCSAMRDEDGELPGRHGQLCFWRGASYDDSGAETHHELFDMLSHRIASQVAEGDADSTESWNEVVLDGERMQQSLASDPRSVVQAFFYVRGRSGNRHAQDMSERFAAEFGVTLPVIELDPAGGADNGPFRVAS